eukprot:jgi/Orpsp1_1/1180273/evm.model.c7180000072746.1
MATTFLVTLTVILIIVISIVSSNGGVINNNGGNNNSSNDNYIVDGEDNSNFIPSMCMDEDSQPSKECYGGWFYKTSTYSAEYNANFAKAKHWNYVLFSANFNKRDLLISNVEAFRRQNITVHFMTLEDTGYLDNPGEGYELMKRVLNFINENSLDVQGVHIDCEPHGHPDWKNGSQEVKNTIFQNYIRVLEECRQAVNEVRPNTTLSAAVAWWYSSHTKSNTLDNGRGYDLVNANRLDFIIPMIYDGAGGTAERVIQRARDYLTDPANTVIGIDVRDYNENLLSNVTTIIDRSRNDYPDYFNGISIYSNHRYDDWGSEIYNVIEDIPEPNNSNNNNNNNNDNNDNDNNENNNNSNNNNSYVPSMCMDEDSQPSKECYGGWFYKTSTYSAEYNANFAKAKHWNYVLFSANINKRDLLISNVEAFRRQNITVHFMTLEDTGYLDNPGEGYELMKRVLNFINENSLDVQGVHIDCEPHGHPDWKNGSQEVKNTIFQNYIRVLEECRQAVNEVRPNTTLSAAVAWWYSSHTKSNTLDNGRGYDLVNANRLDFIIPMIY